MTTLTPINRFKSNLCCHYSLNPAAALLATERALAVISFAGRDSVDPNTPGVIASGLQALVPPGTAAPLEVWEAGPGLQRGDIDHGHWASSDELMFVSQRVDERRYASQSSAIQFIYNRLIQFTVARGYPHLVRVWNYMADINSGDGDQERYRQFCLGRMRAFADNHYQPEQFPAACALGHHGGDTIIYLLAAKQPVRHFENPLQLSAYRYPQQYGPASPSFARATLARWTYGQQLFISGTASIVGHQSLHDDELLQQVQASCHNIRMVMQHVGEQLGKPGMLRLAIAKVYLRHTHQLQLARSEFERHFGTELPTVYLQADVCRRELLVEIEGHCAPI